MGAGARRGPSKQSEPEVRLARPPAARPKRARWPEKTLELIDADAPYYRIAITVPTVLSKGTWPDLSPDVVERQDSVTGAVSVVLYDGPIVGLLQSLGVDDVIWKEADPQSRHRVRESLRSLLHLDDMVHAALSPDDTVSRRTALKLLDDVANMIEGSDQATKGFIRRHEARVATWHGGFFYKWLKPFIWMVKKERSRRSRLRKLTPAWDRLAVKHTNAVLHALQTLDERRVVAQMGLAHKALGVATKPPQLIEGASPELMYLAETPPREGPCTLADIERLNRAPSTVYRGLIRKLIVISKDAATRLAQTAPRSRWK